MQISAQNGPVVAPQRDWTILYVLDGDNDLREAATLDLVELHQQGAPESTAVVAQLYRGDLKWSLANFKKKVDTLFRPAPPAAVAQDWRGMKVFEVRHPGAGGGTVEAPYIPTTASPSPSDPTALESYLAWGMQRYPARHYAVVLSGHGSQEGLLSDSRGQQMAFEDVGQAIRNASRLANQKVDVVLFDSCATAGAEAEASMSGATSYLVATPNPVKGGGWSEKATMDFLKVHPHATPRELAESFLSPQHTAVAEPVLYDYSAKVP